MNMIAINEIPNPCPDIPKSDTKAPEPKAFLYKKNNELNRKNQNI